MAHTYGISAFQFQLHYVYEKVSIIGSCGNNIAVGTLSQWRKNGVILGKLKLKNWKKINKNSCFISMKVKWGNATKN